MTKVWGNVRDWGQKLWNQEPIAHKDPYENPEHSLSSVVNQGPSLTENKDESLELSSSKMGSNDSLPKKAQKHLWTVSIQSTPIIRALATQ